MPAPTGIVHFDTALAVAFASQEPQRSEIYVEVAAGLAESGNVPAAIAILERIPVSDIETALLLSRGWNRVAAADEDYMLQAFRADERVLEVAGDTEDVRTRGDYLLRLLSIQLDNENRSSETIRAAIDELYFLPDDSVRVAALVEAADRIRSSGERVTLTAVVQQAIAVLPSIEDPFLVSALSARLADLSRTINRPRDTETLLQQAVSRAEAGLLVPEAGLPDLRRLVRILAALEGADSAAVVVENVTPRAFRAVAYADLGAAVSPDTADRYFDEALARAADIADTIRRVRTQTTVILTRSESQPGWSPESAAAAALQRSELATQSPELRLEVLTGLGASYFLTGRPGEFDRLRGLIASSGELSSLTVSVAEALFDRGYEGEAAVLLERIEPSPETLIGFSTRPALTAADLMRRLADWDRTVQLLSSASAAGIIQAPEAATIIARIPAEYRPDPVAREQLERLIRE